MPKEAINQTILIEFRDFNLAYFVTDPFANKYWRYRLLGTALYLLWCIAYFTFSLSNTVALLSAGFLVGIVNVIAMIAGAVDSSSTESAGDHDGSAAKYSSVIFYSAYALLSIIVAYEIYYFFRFVVFG
ncbi:hypothetical protein NFC81_15520 [Salinispirillum sp. LH 10-3-1]|uniref:DUF2628 domain-containing protein n=1 Tax=Salinispirillum sp. LH 10-3-1 TaxID=2952525 RepID=A0AB38YFM6_9GAMM